MSGVDQPLAAFDRALAEVEAEVAAVIDRRAKRGCNFALFVWREDDVSMVARASGIEEIVAVLKARLAEWARGPSVDDVGGRPQ